MTNRHCSISLQKQLCHRPSDNLAAANDACIRAAYFDPAVVQQLDDPGGRARHKYWSSHRQPSGVNGMKTIDVLCRIEGFDNRSFINPLQAKEVASVCRRHPHAHSMKRSG